MDGRLRAINCGCWVFVRGLATIAPWLAAQVLLFYFLYEKPAINYHTLLGKNNPDLYLFAARFLQQHLMEKSLQEKKVMDEEQFYFQQKQKMARERLLIRPIEEVMEEESSARADDSSAASERAADAGFVQITIERYF